MWILSVCEDIFVLRAKCMCLSECVAYATRQWPALSH